MIVVSSREYAEMINDFHYGNGILPSDLVEGLRTSEVNWFDVCVHLARINNLDGDHDGEKFDQYIGDLIVNLDQNQLGGISDGIESARF